MADIAGALVATFAMCGPSEVCAYFVSSMLTRSSESAWPAVLQAALVPISIGLMCASGLILALASDRTWIAALLTISSAALTLGTRLNPLWILTMGGVLGFAGVA